MTPTYSVPDDNDDDNILNEDEDSSDVSSTASTTRDDNHMTTPEPERPEPELVSCLTQEEINQGQELVEFAKEHNIQVVTTENQSSSTSRPLKRQHVPTQEEDKVENKKSKTQEKDNLQKKECAKRELRVYLKRLRIDPSKYT